ncbi:MAG: hypothetical protein HY938_04240 [Nitrosomonadales bacterium]|nr:hypothetical protein [Nitrosomonadales bacterium]
MDEEQAVLDFFAQQENLPLGLSVAEQMDRIREQMNSRFWKELRQRLDALIAEQGLPWQTALTEDKNAQDTVVGLYCTPRTEQQIYLRPMAEQQYLGGVWRIYFGLMWSAPPTPDQLALPAVRNLKLALQSAGFKNNESFLAWQWTLFYPRRRDFLTRFAQQPQIILDEAQTTLNTFLIERSNLVEQANTALQAAPRSLAASLNQLRGELLD